MKEILIPIICAILLCSAICTARAADKGDKSEMGDKGSAAGSKEAAAKPKYHIDFKPVDSSKNNRPFQTMQASLPDKAIKVYLHRIKAEPNTFAGLLSADGIESATGTTSVPSLSTSGTAFDTGSAPRIMTTSGTAIPQTTGSSSGFFK
jgi:hypothetical protein